MADIIKPKRTTYSVAINSTKILEKDEMLVITPDTGSGTGKYMIVFGDGVTQVKNLPMSVDGKYADELIIEELEIWTGTDNPDIVNGDSIATAVGKLNAQREYWNTLTGAERAQAFFDSLAGLSNDDFVGVMTWLNTKKLDANMVYNGTDSTNKSQALAAPVGKQLKELTDINAAAISTLNSNLVSAKNEIAKKSDKSALAYQVKNLNGADVVTLPAGRWCANDGIANGERGYWYVEVIEFNDKYCTIKVIPYTSDKKYFYLAKKVEGEWQGWEKYISTI